MHLLGSSDKMNPPSIFYENCNYGGADEKYKLQHPHHHQSVQYFTRRHSVIQYVQLLSKSSEQCTRRYIGTLSFNESHGKDIDGYIRETDNIYPTFSEVGTTFS